MTYKKVFSSTISLAVKSILKKIIKSIFRKKEHIKYPNKGGWSGLKILPKVDFLIDIGIGHQGTEGLYKFFPNSTKYFIDPLIETKKAVSSHLNDSRNKFFECALSSSTGQLDIVVRDPISQSGLNKKSKESNSSYIRSVKVETLDILFPKGTFNSTYGIKIDVEGHELDVIKGGLDLIKESSFIIVETSIYKNRFKDSPSFKDIFLYVTKLGFEIASLRVSEDGIDHCDIAFINKKISPGN